MKLSLNIPSYESITEKQIDTAITVLLIMKKHKYGIDSHCPVCGQLQDDLASHAQEVHGL